MTTKAIEIKWDPVVRRWRAYCPVCQYQAMRAKREAADWAMSNHITYAHEGEAA